MEDQLLSLEERDGITASVALKRNANGEWDCTVRVNFSEYLKRKLQQSASDESAT